MMAIKAWAHQKKGSVKMQHIITATIIVILYSPSIPSVLCLQFQKIKRARGSLMHLDLEMVLQKPQRLLTGSSALWSPKAKVITEVLLPVKGGRWNTFNLFGAIENHLLSKLRKIHENENFQDFQVHSSDLQSLCLCEVQHK